MLNWCFPPKKKDENEADEKSKCAIEGNCIHALLYLLSFRIGYLDSKDVANLKLTCKKVNQRVKEYYVFTLKRYIFNDHDMDILLSIPKVQISSFSLLHSYISNNMTREKEKIVVRVIELFLNGKTKLDSDTLRTLSTHVSILEDSNNIEKLFIRINEIIKDTSTKYEVSQFHTEILQALIEKNSILNFQSVFHLSGITACHSAFKSALIHIFTYKRDLMLKEMLDVFEQSRLYGSIEETLKVILLGMYSADLRVITYLFKNKRISGFIIEYITREKKWKALYESNQSLQNRLDILKDPIEVYTQEEIKKCILESILV
jgi:hypothetical protein